ncbi:TIGR00730 family Rossman fold protein [Methanobrevibacter sp.]|uniref:LOG family protein n=1 Tax=Methanobrevibacter sp. TaxID=66852 RepID=UPI00388F62AF
MRICFYGAGSKELKSKYIEEGYKLGQEIAKKGHELVFGGGINGMMGAVSKGVMDNGGQALGIAPSWINEFEPLKNSCTEFIYTKTMDERKNLFLEHSDVFVIGPGGIGTLDEFYEIITLKALNQHDKNIVVFNCHGFYNKLNETFLYMVGEGVIKRDMNELFQVRQTVEEVMDYVENPQD